MLLKGTPVKKNWRQVEQWNPNSGTFVFNSMLPEHHVHKLQNVYSSFYYQQPHPSSFHYERYINGSMAKLKSKDFSSYHFHFWRFNPIYVVNCSSFSVCSFLFGWPPCQRSDMAFMKVSQCAYNPVCTRNIYLHIYESYVNLTWYLRLFLLFEYELGWYKVHCQFW